MKPGNRHENASGANSAGACYLRDERASAFAWAVLHPFLP